jgi:uncharacterized protein (DUF302 family)
MNRQNALVGLGLTILLLSMPQISSPDSAGLITKPSKYSVQETIKRFETAVTAKGWVVFTELDHAAAAAKFGLELRPRTVVVFGNPRIGTPAMQKAPTLGIDVPAKALVWEDDQGKVWLTYNSADYLGGYIYPRHGLTMAAEARQTVERTLVEFSDQGTQ